MHFVISQSSLLRFKGGDPVLQGATDKPHGLRECYIADPDGYVWVPGVAIGGKG